METLCATNHFRCIKYWLIDINHPPMFCNFTLTTWEKYMKIFQLGKFTRDVTSQSFCDSDCFSSKILQLLKKHGYEKPTPIQAQAIPGTHYTIPLTLIFQLNIDLDPDIPGIYWPWPRFSRYISTLTLIFQLYIDLDPNISGIYWPWPWFSRYT